MSRVVDRRVVFGDKERARFRHLMRTLEGYCGVRVLTYCLMGNHVHLLLEVPPPPPGGLSDEDFFKRLQLIQSPLQTAQLRKMISEARASGGTGAERLKAPYLRRMWDLSAFMKSLKQAFTQWFNREHERRGTLWESRFKSTLVEDSWSARVVAAYIDLNPVRAGLVEDPALWPWSGYGEAVTGTGRGAKLAREGLCRVWWAGEAARGGQNEKPPIWSGGRGGGVAGAYRAFLLTRDDPAAKAGIPQPEESGKRAKSRQRKAAGGSATGLGEVGSAKAEGVTGEGSAARAKVPLDVLLRGRVRQFEAGLAVGSKEFLEQVFQASPDWFGARRRTGARHLRKSAAPLYALRDLGDG